MNADGYWEVKSSVYAKDVYVDESYLNSEDYVEDIYAFQEYWETEFIRYVSDFLYVSDGYYDSFYVEEEIYVV